MTSKTKYCLTIDEPCIMEEHKTFKGFNDSKKLLACSRNFKMIEGEKISAMLTKSWKQSFNRGIVIPAKEGFCNECYD